MIRKFYLLREKDISGVSGTGRVGEGVQFMDTGEVVLHWYGAHSSITIYHSIDDLLFIHSHGNCTKIVFED